jgi:hypothetical protein
MGEWRYRWKERERSIIGDGLGMSWWVYCGKGKLYEGYNFFI